MKIDYKKNKLQILTFIVLGAIPLFVDSYYLDNISYFMCWTFISLGLAVIWGMGGILSFGQTAFFGLAGLTGALYAPTMTIVPSIGQAFIVSAFITVVTAGASPFIGLVPAAAFLGTVQTTVTFFFKSTIGLIAILCAVILIIRYLPNGFSGLLLKKRSK